MKDKTMTRKQAKELGLHKYYDGVLCKKGHNTMRYTRTGTCWTCSRIYQRGYKRDYRRIPEFKLVAIKGKKCHPDDMQLIYRYIDALNAARRFI